MEVEGYHDGSTDIPLEHAEVCAGDIAECELDESQRTVHGLWFDLGFGKKLLFIKTTT